MVPNIEADYILLLGYSILYKEYNLTRFSWVWPLFIAVNRVRLLHGLPPYADPANQVQMFVKTTCNPNDLQFVGYTYYLRSNYEKSVGSRIRKYPQQLNFRTQTLKSRSISKT